MIDKNLVKKLNLPRTRSNVSIKDIAGSISLLYSNYKLVIQLLIKNERVQLNNVMVNKLSTILPKKVISRGLADLCLSKTRIRIKPSIENPQILIGQDNCRLLRARESFLIDNNLAISRCNLGWSIHGKVEFKALRSTEVSLTCGTKIQFEENDRKNSRDLKTNNIINSYF